MNNASSDKCPLCGGGADIYARGNALASTYFASADSYSIADGQEKVRLPIYRCRSCGHGFTPLDISGEVIERWYMGNEPDKVFLSDEPARRKTANILLQRIEKEYGRKGKLLDIGAGPGLFVSEAVKHGWQAQGLEVSAWAVNHARESYGVEVEHGNLSKLQQYSADSFDVVTLFDVIEHVADPAGLLTDITRILRPGGLLVLTTPRLDSFLARASGPWWYCIFPAHIHYFSLLSLDKALRKAGLVIVRRRAHVRYLGLGYFWQRLNKMVVPSATFSPRASLVFIPVCFGDELEILAKK